MKALSTEVRALTVEAIASGVYALGEAHAYTVSRRTFEVFLNTLTGHMCDEEFRAVVARALETEERWCSPAVLLRIMRQLREETIAEGYTEQELDDAERDLDAAASRS